MRKDEVITNVSIRKRKMDLVIRLLLQRIISIRCHTIFTGKLLSVYSIYQDVRFFLSNLRAIPA